MSAHVWCLVRDWCMRLSTCRRDVSWHCAILVRKLRQVNKVWTVFWNVWNVSSGTYDVLMRHHWWLPMSRTWCVNAAVVGIEYHWRSQGQECVGIAYCVSVIRSYCQSTSRSLFLLSAWMQLHHHLAAMTAAWLTSATSKPLHASEHVCVIPLFTCIDQHIASNMCQVGAQGAEGWWARGDLEAVLVGWFGLGRFLLRMQAPPNKVLLPSTFIISLRSPPFLPQWLMITCQWWIYEGYSKHPKMMWRIMNHNGPWLFIILTYTVCRFSPLFVIVALVACASTQRAWHKYLVD